MNSGEVNQELISITSPDKWRDALAGIPYAFGHTWENCYSMQLTTGYNTFLYSFQKEDVKIVCPLAERTYNGFTDIVTPYGFSGFTGNKTYTGFPQVWKEFAVSRGYVCGYIGLNPYLQGQAFVEEKDLFQHHSLFSLNLELTIEQLYQNLSSNRKRQLKSVQLGSDLFCSDKAKLKPFFLQHFHSFFAERNASAVYNFSFETLSFLFDLDNVIAVGIEQENKIKAVSLFAYTDSIAEYLFNVSAFGGHVYTASLIWHAVHTLKESKVPVLNLGGGISENDSIADFKMRFGPETISLMAAKQVYNKESYEQLCREKNIDGNDRTGFFPPYRQSS